MNTGAFVCPCGSGIDVEAVRDGVADVDVVASSELLCDDGLEPMADVVEEYDLDQLIVTASDDGCRKRFRAVTAELGLHPEAVSFVDHRETAALVHDQSSATEKITRLVNASYAGLQAESVSRSVSRDADETVAVVGDAETAAALADSADVTLIADGRDFADADVDLADVTVERGRVGRVDGQYGEFDLTLEARVTEACISCMDCVAEGPEGAVTRQPVDIAPDADGGEWVDVCPTDAIDLTGVERTVTAAQVVYPDADRQTRGGQLGLHTGPVDADTVAAVHRLVDGVEKHNPLDLEMDVCAAGKSSTEGCTACSDACPHGAVERPRIDEVAFDEVACQNCGACTSACPTGAVQLREPSNERLAREVEALLEPDDSGWLLGSPAIEPQVVAFVCSERAERALRAYGRRAAAGADVEYPPVLPVRVNCADAVGDAHVLHSLAAGADGVAVVGCGERCLHSGPEPKAALVDRLNAATADLGLGERVAFVAPDPDDPAAFSASLSSFADGLDPSPVPAGEHEARGSLEHEHATGVASEFETEFDNHGWALESVRAILEYVEPRREVIRGLSDFGRMAVSDDCVVSPTCSTLCPTDAIRRTDDGDLQFNHERCVDCELCESGCQEGAITMRDGLDLTLLPEHRDGDAPAWTTVYEGEMLDCARCGTSFTSKGTAERVQSEVGDMVEDIAPNADGSIFEYCDDCRARLLFEGG